MKFFKSMGINALVVANPKDYFLHWITSTAMELLNEGLGKRHIVA
jgi:hypothetical protein